ncbi:MAG: type II toxin-antitoxin system VapC family toxin [Chloroflexi bacterium]|nr:type II toxin-antitoxin system VapC family toxin [Chloroflexota bacterium]
MKYLLDTQAFLLWDMESSKLPTPVFELLHDKSHILLLSIASAWEMQIKQQIGKLQLGASLTTVIENQQQNNGILLLPIQLTHIVALDQLPPHHKDPFDRLLIAQARVENLILISGDPIFKQYPVQVMW